MWIDIAAEVELISSTAHENIVKLNTKSKYWEEK